MKARGCPVCLYLNGATGNIIFVDYTRGGRAVEMEKMGQVLADDVQRVLDKIEYRSQVRLGAASRTVDLPFRAYTQADIDGTAPGTQRYGVPGVYDRRMANLIRRIERLGAQPAEVQVLRLDDWVLVGVPGELFVQIGLAIKTRAHPCHALVVELANGAIGYIPHKEAFHRGGYETTFGSSVVAPEAGDVLADAVIELIGRVEAAPSSRPA